MKPYEEYKDSGVEWIGKIPSHWVVIRPKYLVKKPVEYGLNLSSDMYSDSGVRFIRTTDIDDMGLLSSEGVYLNEELIDESSLLEEGDFLISRSGTIGRAYVHSLSNIPASWAGYLVRLKFSRLSICKYFFWFTKSKIFESWLDENRIESTISNVNGQKYANIPVPFPDSTSEIECILDYIEKKISLIDALIAKKERQVELLREQRVAMINQAVTKGLNPNAPMKDSGVEWIGEIPRHWEAMALKNIVNIKITDGPHETPELVDEGIPFVSAEAVQGGKVNLDSRRGNITKEQHEIYAKKCLAQRNDIFLVKSGATTGKLAYVDIDDEFAIWSPLALIRANSEIILSKLLFLSLGSSYFQNQVQIFWSYGTQPNIGMKVLENLKVIVPSFIEQTKLLTQLEKVTLKIDTLIGKVEKQIELQKEYRTALISAAVTGKIDVRG
jgi:type I restriction enzyme S subunit